MLSKIRFVTDNLDRLHRALVEDAEDDDAECKCWKCGWTGYYEDCEERLIRATYYDPEERYAVCPKCGADVEPVEC